MQFKTGQWMRVSCAALAWLAAAGLAQAATTPTVEQALQLRPIQDDVEYDIPKADEVKGCSIKPESINGQKGWVVRDAVGQALRRFVDTNSDNVVDLWCYYQRGIEVYRDIDANHNGKADQYRWLNIGGTRWGLDKNEDGKIDVWKQISAEEVSSEVVRALATRDADRFSRLLLTSEELKSLGLGKLKAREIAAKLAAAKKQFTALSRKQKVVTSQTKWIHFGATRPGVVPAGDDGSTKDLLVYEDVAIVVETAGKPSQLQIGTFVRAGNVWRLVDLPRALDATAAVSANTGVFFQASLATPTSPANRTTGAPSDKVQDLLAELEKIDQASEKASSRAEQAKYHARRADLIEKIAEEAPSKEDRRQWIHQLADTVSAAAQSGEYAGGVERLKKLHDKLAKDDANQELAAYTEFRYLSADYGQSLQSKNADFAKIQTAWLKNLEQYVKDYPKSPDTPEAMLQLAIAEEFAGQEAPAQKWYHQIIEGFPNSAAARKASGASRRLDAVGKPMRLKGKTVDGKTVDLAKYKGRVVLVHYWATWCEPCKQDLSTIKDLLAKYGRSGFLAIGVNLDTEKTTVARFLEKTRLPWPQLFEPGGLDSRLANEMGVLTLPTMVLVGKDGKVVDRNIHISQIEPELKRLLQ